MFTEIISRRLYCYAMLLALLGAGSLSARAQNNEPESAPRGGGGGPRIGISINLTSGSSVTASTYYNLVGRMARCLKLPEKTPEERELKVGNLTDTYTFKDRLPSKNGVGKTARFIWNTMNGQEAKGGYPVQRGGGSAGTVPRKGYRPHLLDLYANWKAANLAADQAAKTHYYKEVLAALPPINTNDRIPYIYKSPIVYALVADANWRLGERVEQSFLLWRQLDEETIKNAKLRADDKNLERKKNNFLLNQLRMDLKVDPQNQECNSTVTDAIARAIFADAQLIKGEMAQAVQASIAFSEVALDQRDLAQPPVITGVYAGAPAEGMAVRLPLTLWAEDEAGTVIGDRRDVQPGDGFTLVLNNIGAENGVARVCWALREDALATLLQIPVTNRMADGFAYIGAVQAEERFRVRFRAKGGQADAWAAVSGAREARNRDAIAIRYDWNSSTMKSPFAWRINRVEDGNMQPAAVFQHTETAPSGTLTVPAGTLNRGSYILTVQQDTRKAEPVDFAAVFTFRVTSPAVALVIGVADYYSAALNHPGDDASAIVAHLKAADYTDEDIIWVYGERDRDNKRGRLIAHGLGKSLATLDSIVGKKVQALDGSPDTVVVDNAYVTPDVMELARRTFANIIIDRRPIHALFFYAGHGTSEQDKGSIADVLVSARPPEVPGWDKDLYLNQFTELKGLLATQAQQGMAIPPTFVSIMDACRPSVAGVEAKGLGSRLTAGVQDDVLLLPVYSAALGEISFETGAKGDEILYQNQPVPHGLFTFSLLRGLDRAGGNYAVKSVLPLTVDVMKELMTQVNELNARRRGPEAASTTQTVTIGKVKLDSGQAVSALGDLVLQVPLIY